MHVRKLALVVGLISALGADIASALGLGEIKLNSTLNQPLDAEIKLLQARDLAEEEILIRLASREDFDRAGVERVFFLSDIKFTVELGNRSGPIVRLTSSKPVREPFLNFLLETQWPSGRLLREYTLLMDLPVFSTEAVRPIQGAQTQPSPQAAVRSAPEPVRERPQQAAPQQRQPEPAGRVEPQGRVEVYGPVSEEDTLWEIALKVRPDRSTSVQQTMLAVQRLNPEAFINDNINLLRKGQVLRIPDRDQIYELSAQQAIEQVAEQNSEWSRDAGAQLEGGRRLASGSSTQAPGQGRVSLVTPGSAESTASGKGSGAAQGDVEALENDLLIAMEELDKSRRENAELTSRIKDLEAQISTMERLVDVSNQELRALQLASQQSAAQEAPASSSTGIRQPLAEQQPGLEEELLDEEQLAGDPEQQQLAGDPEQLGTEDPEQLGAVAEPPPAAAVRERPRLRDLAAEEEASRAAERSSQRDKSLLDLVFENIAWIGGGLLALLAGVMLFMRRRAQLASEEELDELEALPENDFFEDTDIEEEAYSDERLVANEDMEHESNLEEELAIATEEADSSVEPETGDVVGEADIYIAYGKFDQAEEMLRKALDDEPDRIDVQLKLLEVYAESKNLDKFDQQYGQLLTYNDEGANQRAVELRRHFPDAGEFNTGAAAVAAVAAPVTAAAAADQFAPEPESYDSSVESEVAADDTGMSMDDMDDLSLDLDLDLDLEEEGENPATAEVGDLDFDLDLDMEDTPEAAAEEQEGDLDFDLDLDLDEEPSAYGYKEPSADRNYKEPSADHNYEEPSADHNYEAPSADNYHEEPAPRAQAAADEFDLQLDLESEKTAQSSDDLAAMDFDSAGSDQDFDLDFSAFDDEEPREEAAADLDLLHREPVQGSRPAPVAGAAQEGFSAQGEEFELDLDDFSGDDLAAASLGQEDAMGFEDDDFDLDISDVDMAALDQEVESMEADFDFGELGDDEFDLSLEGETKKPAMREPVTDFGLSGEAQPANEEQHSAADMDEDFFTAALSGVPEMEKTPASANGNGHGHGALVDEDAELDFLADTDEAATKLDLARAYIDMGDKEGAKDILDEVAQEGDDRQRQEAQDLLAKIG